MELKIWDKSKLTAEFDSPTFHGGGGHERIEIVMMCEIDAKTGQPIIKIDPDFFSAKTEERFKEMERKISECKPLPEKIDDLLHTFLSNYFSKHDIKAYDEKYHNLTRIDFMQKRDLLSEILQKHEGFNVISELASKEDVKSFTKRFFSLITNRNIYTHGVLQLMYPEDIFLVKFRNKQGEYERFIVNDGEVEIQNENAKLIFSVLQKLIQLEQNK